MRSVPFLQASAVMLLLTTGMVGAQETGTAGPSPGQVAVSGVAPTRFNPTHGTVFFTLRDAYFPSDSRDVAVIIDDRQLPVGDLSVSRRIVAAAYIMNPGTNTVTLRAWDAAGQVLTTGVTVWAGDLPLAVDVTDPAGRPVETGEVVASLVRDPAVKSVVPIRDGRAEVVNLPDADIRIEARQGAALRAESVFAARERRVSLILR